MEETVTTGAQVDVEHVVEPLIDVDPPAKPAPAAEEQKTDTVEGEAPPKTEVETTEQQEAHKQSKFQRRLERQKTARIQAETRAQIAEERLAKFEAQSKQQPEGEPKRNDIDPETGEPYDYDVFLRRVSRWEARQVGIEERKAEREARQGQEKQTQLTEQQRKLADTWLEREKQFQTSTKDYGDVVKPFVDSPEGLGAFSDMARTAMIESELGPQLLHYLASNEDVSERIADLSPPQQVKELGKLEVKLSTPVPKKTSSAPAPPTPVSQGRSAPAGYSENMSDTEYAAWRKTQGARWAR